MSHPDQEQLLTAPTNPAAAAAEALTGQSEQLSLAGRIGQMAMSGVEGINNLRERHPVIATVGEVAIAHALEHVGGRISRRTGIDFGSTFGLDLDDPSNFASVRRRGGGHPLLASATSFAIGTAAEGVRRHRGR